MSFTFASLWSGAGGFDLGLIHAGLVPIVFNDISKDCCTTLKINHPNVPVVEGCMETVDVGGTDLIVGGVLCQSFSQAGMRLGLDDPRGMLIYKFIEIIHKSTPKIFLIENVKGLKTHNNGKTIADLITYIESKNKYTVKYEVLNAYDYEVPQKRERIFIVGVLKYLGKEFIFPIKSENKVVLKDVLVNVPPSGCAKYSNEKIRLFKKIPQGGCWINLTKEEQMEYLGNSYNSGGGKRGILKRLSMEEPSLTLLCSPSQKQTERCHPIETRPLSIRECARIQTFPDDYQFSGNISSQYKQIGNAVPVKLAEKNGRCFDQIFKYLKKF